VFVGADKITGEIVALKRINTEEEENGFPITAIREVKILKALNHENIVKLKEIVTSKGESPLPQSHSLMGLCCCDVYAMYIYIYISIYSALADLSLRVFPKLFDWIFTVQPAQNTPLRYVLFGITIFCLY
jgi:serine/threonine protein kinase